MQYLSYSLFITLHTDEYAESIYAICNSLQFVTLFIPMNEDMPLLKKAITSWNKHQTGVQHHLYSEIDNVMRILRHMHVIHEDVFKILVFETVFQNDDLVPSAPFSYLKKNQRRSLYLGWADKPQTRGASNTIIYVFINVFYSPNIVLVTYMICTIVNFPLNMMYLCNALRNNRSARVIFDTTLKLMEKLPTQAKTNPEATQNILLILLYMLKEFLHIVSLLVGICLYFCSSWVTNYVLYTV